MSDNYFKTGLENLKKIDGTAGSNVIENLSDIAPDLARYIIEFAFWPDLRTSRAQSAGTRTADAVQPFDCRRLRSPAAGTYQRSITCWHKRRKNYRSISALHTLYGFP